MNELLEVLLIAVALGMDAFSIALGLGLTDIRRPFKIKFVAAVTAAHVVMPLAGLYIGLAAGHFLGKWASFLGAAVLAYLGFRMIREGWATEGAVHYSIKRLQGWMGIILLTLSVSVDALVAGFSLGVSRFPIILTVFALGTVAGAMTALGWLGGKYVGQVIGRRAQAAGGLVLIILAVKMLC